MITFNSITSVTRRAHNLINFEFRKLILINPCVSADAVSRSMMMEVRMKDGVGVCRVPQASVSEAQLRGLRPTVVRRRQQCAPDRGP